MKLFLEILSALAACFSCGFLGYTIGSKRVQSEYAKKALAEALKLCDCRNCTMKISALARP